MLLRWENFVFIMLIFNKAVLFAESKRDCELFHKYGKENVDNLYVAFLFVWDDPDNVCVGAIISSRWVLHACENRKNKSKIFDHVKTATIKVPFDKTVNTYKIAERIVYPGYLETQLTSNGKKEFSEAFASKHSVILEKTVKPMGLFVDVARDIKLSRFPVTAKDVRVISYSPKKIDRVQFSDVAIKDKSKCNHFYKDNGVEFQDNQFCIWNNQLTNSACMNSALVISSNTLIGLMAWPTICADLKYPIAFIDISEYHTWIFKYIQQPLVIH